MPHDSDSGGSSESEVIFEDNGDYIETNLITEEDLKSYRLHVATQEGSKGAPLNEALPAIELAKIIYKRRKLKEDAKEVEEREKSIEKLKDKLKKKKKKKNRSRSKSPKSKKNRQYRQKKSASRSRSKSPKRGKSKSPKKSKHSKSRSKSPKKSRRSKSRSKSPKKSKRSRSRSKSPKKSSRSRRSSRSKSSSRTKSRRRSRSRRRDSGRHSRRRGRSRSRSRGRSRSRSKGRRRRRKRIWESKSRSRSRSDSRDKDDYVRKCKSIQDGPDLPVSRPLDRRRRRRSRSSSSSVERPPRGLPSSSSYLAIEGPEMDKALVTLYPSATPSLAAPTLDRVRLPPALAQQLFPVSCGSDHKTEESEKAAASVLAIEGPKEDGDDEGEEEGEIKPPPSLSEIMQMRIEANKLLLKNPGDLAAKKILHEAQILMNQWQSSSVRNAGGRYTGAPLATPLPRELLDCHHPLTWARKDMFQNLAPITESPGISLMMKMGWTSGQGLGKEGTGDVNPLQLSVKTDRKGTKLDRDTTPPSLAL